MIQELDSQLTRMDIINSIKEKYVGENCRMEYLSGGILNSANNNEPSIIRLFDDTNSYVLKIATKNSILEVTSIPIIFDIVSNKEGTPRAIIIKKPIKICI